MYVNICFNGVCEKTEKRKTIGAIEEDSKMDGGCIEITSYESVQFCVDGNLFHDELLGFVESRTSSIIDDLLSHCEDICSRISLERSTLFPTTSAMTSFDGRQNINNVSAS